MHNNNELNGAPRLVAHRGLHAEVRGGARENTLAAVHAAVSAGVTWVEIDVRVTSDGVVVLLHDRTLERLWGDPRAIAEVSSGEVLELGAGDRRIPLLADVLRLLHGSGTTLLIDMDDAEPALPAYDVVAGCSLDVTTAWCGEREAMRRIREQDPAATIWTPWYSAVPPRATDLEGVDLVNIEHDLVGPAFVEAVHD